MRCTQCKELFGNMKDDGIQVNPILKDLCGYCWGENNQERISKKLYEVGFRSGTGIIINGAKDDN